MSGAFLVTSDGIISKSWTLVGGREGADKLQTIKQDIFRY